MVTLKSNNFVNYSNCQCNCLIFVEEIQVNISKRRSCEINHSNGRYILVREIFKFAWNIVILQSNSGVMKHERFHFILCFFLTLALSRSMVAQSWDFIKEKDGIKIYTRIETGKSLKSYKGVTDIHAPAKKVFTLLENVYNTDWWDKNLTQIKVLLYEKDKRAQYYLVYDLPWPVTDRDLCVDVKVTIDTLTGESRITAVPLPGGAPEHDDMIRIKEYRQTWSVKPAGEELAHVVLEGYVDPAGSIPDWLSNMLIVDSPLKIISGVKQRLEKK